MKAIAIDSYTILFLNKVEQCNFLSTFALQMHTTDLIMHKLKLSDIQSYKQFTSNFNNLVVANFSATQLQDINRLKTLYTQLYSITMNDCSILYYAKTNTMPLITEDKILTEIALGLNIEVLSTSKLFSTTRHIETNTQKKPPLINNETDITT